MATNTTPSIFSSLVSSFAYKIPHFIPHFALLPLITTPSSHLERSPSLLFSLSLFDEGSPPAPLARSRWVSFFNDRIILRFWFYISQSYRFRNEAIYCAKGFFLSSLINNDQSFRKNCKNQDFCPHRCRSLLLRVRVRERSLRALLLRRMPTGFALSALFYDAMRMGWGARIVAAIHLRINNNQKDYYGGWRPGGQFLLSAKWALSQALASRELSTSVY